MFYIYFLYIVVKQCSKGFLKTFSSHPLVTYNFANDYDTEGSALIKISKKN